MNCVGDMQRRTGFRHSLPLEGLVSHSRTAGREGLVSHSRAAGREVEEMGRKIESPDVELRLC